MKLWLALSCFVSLVADAEAQRGRISAPLAPGRDVIQFAITPDGLRAVYRADADRDQVFELHGVTTDGLGTPVKLHPALPSGRSVFGFRIDPGGTRVVYHANPFDSGKIELFSVPVDASQAPVRLSSATFGSTTGGVQALDLFGEPLYEITSDGSRVVFVASGEVTSSQANLYSAPIDGTPPTLKLNPNLGLVGNMGVSIVSRIRISPDGTRVVYQADQEVAVDRIQIYSVPLDGSAPSVALNGPLVAGGNVVSDAFAITSDSSRVVYLADQDTDGVLELYSASLDGVGGATKLSGLLVTGGQVLRDFALTPDGSRVLYRADQDVDGAVRLYSVPVDGSAPPIAIGGDGTGGRTVMHFSVSPLGGIVAYCADQDSPKVFEVYIVALDGSSASLDLGGPFPPDADVFPELRFTADGSSLLFLVDAEENQRFDLYRVPADGTAPPLRLSAADTDADVRAFTPTPDGTQVVLLADVETDEVPELYHVPVGGGPNHKLSPALEAGREVLSRFEARNDVSYYLADRSTDGVFELYRSFQPPQRPLNHTQPASAPTRTVTLGL